jgi:hypothetical protein
VTDHTCTQDRRLTRLEERADGTDKRLAAGDVGFAELRKDVAALTGKVGDLTDAIKGAVRWLLGLVGTAAFGAVVWALVQSQKGTP